MSQTKSPRFHRLAFAGSVALAWTLLTGLVLLAALKDTDTSWLRVGSWLSLWVSTIVLPTSNALTVRRVGLALPNHQPDDRLTRDLLRMPAVLVLTANLALLSAIVLLLGR